MGNFMILKDNKRLVTVYKIPLEQLIDPLSRDVYYQGSSRFIHSPYEQNEFHYRKGHNSYLYYLQKNRKYQEKYGYFMFCSGCRQHTEAHVTFSAIELEPRHRGLAETATLGSSEVSSILCPLCGHKTEKHDIIFFREDFQTAPYRVFEGAYDREDKVSVALTNHYANLSNDKESFKLTCIGKRYTFNVATGQSYQLPTFVDERRNKKTGIKNISYLTFEDQRITKEVFKKAFEMIWKKKKELLGFDPITEEAFFDGKLENQTYFEVSMLVSFNRMPVLPYRTNCYYMTSIGKRYFHKKMKDIRHTEPDPMGAIAKKMNFKLNRTYRKLFFERIELMPYVSVAQKYFKSTENIIKVASYFMDDLKEGDLLMTHLIEKFGEKIAAIKATSSDSHYVFRDTSTIYRSLIVAHPDKDYSLTGNIDEIHDRLNLDYIRMTNDGYSFNYEDELFEKFDANYGGYSFSLVPESLELQVIGGSMRICVGSYSYRSLQRECYIVAMTHKGRYICCIEIRKDQKSVAQAKTRFNELPKDYTLSLLHEWIKEKKLKIDTRDIAKYESYAEAESDAMSCIA